LWLHSLKVAQLLRSAACLHTNQSRSYLNHLDYTIRHSYRWFGYAISTGRITGPVFFWGGWRNKFRALCRIYVAPFVINCFKTKKPSTALKTNDSTNSSIEITLMSAFQLYCYTHPIQTQVLLNTTLLLAQTVKKHVSIAYRIIIRHRVKTIRKK
jgi:hypothetical protein